ncbi:MAG: S-layer homology domain-containing protein [Clostridiales bacterium]|nr:S-layer homology domain-containing protein [Clostridiales bacterium]
MTLGVMSFTALAETTYTVDGSENTNVSAVLAKMSSENVTSATIILDTDTTEDIEIPSNMEITLNLNGYKITNYSSHTITNYGTLTITGSGTVDNVTHAKAALVNYGTVYVYGGTYTRSLEAGSSSKNNGGNSYYTIKNYNQMTISGDVTIKNSGCYSSCVANGYQNSSDKAAAVAITGSVTPTLTIEDGVTISGGINTVKNDDNAVLVINGGTFTNENQGVIQNHSTATIKGGTFEASENASWTVYNCGCDSTSDVGVLTIEGGTYTSDSYVLVLVSTANTAVVSISGGTFESSSSSVIGVGELYTDDAEITGGTYSSSVASFAADGYYQVASSDGTTYKYYESEEAAKAAASDEDIVASVEVLTSGETTYTVTLKANGGTIAKYDDDVEIAYETVAAGDYTLPTATRSGYTFDGWKTGSKTYKAGSEYEVTGNVTFTAQWTKKTTSSSYSLSETTGSSSSSDEDEEDNTTVTTPSTTDTTSSVFADLSTSHPYYDSIMTAYENGWMVGVSSDTLAAEGYLTRAMAAKILHNVADNPEATDVALFLDVPSGEWYSEAIAWAYEQGIVVGYDAQTFGPNDYVTVNQFCIMLAKYRGEEVPEYTSNSPYATRGLIANMIVG